MRMMSGARSAASRVMNHWWNCPVVTSTATLVPGWFATNSSAIAWYDSRSSGMFHEDRRRCLVPVGAPEQAASAPATLIPATAMNARRDSPWVGMSSPLRRGWC
jgi:hypothetical protein